MAGISISIGSDEKDFLRGVKNSADGADDLADALADVDKAGDKAGTQLENDFKDAQKQTKKFTDAVKDGQDALRQTSTVSKTTNREVNDDLEKATGERKKLNREAIEEIGNEAKANASETFSSFDGSAQSFVDGIQGTLGGLVSSLGPVGLAAGAAGALAIGLINGALGKADEQSQAFKQDVADLTTELINSGKIGTVSVGYIVSELQKLATESDSTKVSLSKLDDVAKKSGASYKDLADAYAGDVQGLKDLQTEGKKRAEQLNKEASDSLALTSTNKDLAQGYHDQAVAQGEVNDYLDKAADKAGEAAKQQKLYVEAGGPEMERKAALIDQINTAYDEAAGAVDDYVDKETGIFDTSKYIAAMLARQQALKDYQTTLATSGLPPEAITYLTSQGEDAAATLLQGYKNGTAAQQSVLAGIWQEAGSTSSGSYTTALKNGLPSTVPGPKVVIPAADFTAYDKSMAYLKQQQTQRIILEGVTRNGQKLF
jgi:hypothetical protein